MRVIKVLLGGALFLHNLRLRDFVILLKIGKLDLGGAKEVLPFRQTVVFLIDSNELESLNELLLVQLVLLVRASKLINLKE